MTALEVREKLRKFFFKLNRKQMIALSEVIADSGSGNNNSGGIDTSDITEINDSNIQQVLKAASGIILKEGYDVNKERSEGEIPTTEPHEFLLFVRTYDNNLIPLPVNYIDTFIGAGIPPICTMRVYMANDHILPLLNVDSDSIVISDTQANYFASLSFPCEISPHSLDEPNHYDIVPYGNERSNNYVQDSSCSNKLTKFHDPHEN